jgi:hypothetical protein
MKKVKSIIGEQLMVVYTVSYFVSLELLLIVILAGDPNAPFQATEPTLNTAYNVMCPSGSKYDTVGDKCIWRCENYYNDDPDVCNGRGSCLNKNECTCNANYSGTNCDYPFCFGIPSNKGNACSGKL